MLLNLLFMLFCREIFATIYALSCGEKLSKKVHLRRKITNMRSEYYLHNIYQFLGRYQPFAQKGTRYEQKSLNLAFQRKKCTFQITALPCLIWFHHGTQLQTDIDLEQALKGSFKQLFDFLRWILKFFQWEIFTAC